VERNYDEEEDEFMMVMFACKERKKFEDEVNRPINVEKLS